MAKILVQTTIVETPDDWNSSRFSMLARELRDAGHDVTARGRAGADDDPVLSRVDTSDVDQLWLLAVDVGAGLTTADAAAIARFRERGGGVLTARDHQDLGSSLLALGDLGAINHFHSRNPQQGERRDDQDNPGISWPNYHSGANGDYQPLYVVEPVHPVLRTPRTASGHIEWFPAHPHEGSVTALPGSSTTRSIAQGRSVVTGRRFDLAVVLDGERTPDGRPMGRAIACSTFHHFADINWDPGAAAPSFVTDVPGDEIRRDPGRLADVKQYVRNIATWLGAPPREDR